MRSRAAACESRSLGRVRAAGWALAFLAGACAQGRSRVDLAQPIPPIRISERPLQVAVHDLVERSPSGAAVRLCRKLADVPVSLETSAPTSLGDALGALADQAGTELTITSSASEPEPLPTLRCPGAGSDYLTIGRPPD